ncbi:hypothetical protein GF362_00315 [Candidatus Dojkabacteria bacterium]|nr:hypothetical protein [Candidatus Dojkabacteria bacterium]
MEHERIQHLPTVNPEEWMRLGDSQGVVLETESESALTFLQKERYSPKWQHLWEPVEQTEDSNYDPSIVVLFGPSGAGKDIVVEEIEKEFGAKVTHLSSDCYYGPGGENEELESKYYLNNYDHPNSVDWDLLRHHIDLLKNGFVIRKPLYDFTTHSRIENDFEEISPSPVIIVSGIMTAHTLGDLADMLLAVNASWDECITRRIERDINERGRTRGECAEQIKSTVYPGYEAFVKPYLDQIYAGNWEQNDFILIENEDHCEEGFEPARINKHLYIQKLKQLISPN